VRGVEERTPKGGYSMGERPKEQVLLHCTTCGGEFPTSRLRLRWVAKGQYDMVCPGCDPDMRRA